MNLDVSPTLHWLISPLILVAVILLALSISGCACLDHEQGKGLQDDFSTSQDLDAER